MIIKKKLSPGDIVSIKMITTEEVLAKVIEDTQTTLKVSKPVILAQTPSGGVAVVPFIVTADKPDVVDFDKSHIITILATSKAFADQYIKITSGIQPASESDLLRI